MLLIYKIISDWVVVRWTMTTFVHVKISPSHFLLLQILLSMSSVPCEGRVNFPKSSSFLTLNRQHYCKEKENQQSSLLEIDHASKGKEGNFIIIVKMDLIFTGRSYFIHVLTIRIPTNSNKIERHSRDRFIFYLFGSAISILFYSLYSFPHSGIRHWNIKEIHLNILYGFWNTILNTAYCFWLPHRK